MASKSGKDDKKSFARKKTRSRNHHLFPSAKSAVQRRTPAKPRNTRNITSLTQIVRSSATKRNASFPQPPNEKVKAKVTRQNINRKTSLAEENATRTKERPLKRARSASKKRITEVNAVNTGMRPVKRARPAKKRSITEENAPNTGMRPVTRAETTAVSASTISITSTNDSIVDDSLNISTLPSSSGDPGSPPTANRGCTPKPSTIITTDSDKRAPSSGSNTSGDAERLSFRHANHSSNGSSTPTSYSTSIESTSDNPFDIRDFIYFSAIALFLLGRVLFGRHDEVPIPQNILQRFLENLRLSW